MVVATAAAGASARLGFHFGTFTFGGGRVLCFELLQILLIGFKLGRLLIFGQFCIVLFFGTVGLSFTALAFFCGQDLPSLPNDLGNFCEGQVLPFQGFPHLIRKDYVSGWRPLRSMFIGLGMPPVLSLSTGAV